MSEQNNNKKNHSLNQSVKSKTKSKTKKERNFIVLYERYLLDGNLDILDKLFYAFFVSLHDQGCVIDITNEGLAKKIKIKPTECLSTRMVQRSLEKLEDLGYIQRFYDPKTNDRIIIPIIKYDEEEFEEYKGRTYFGKNGQKLTIEDIHTQNTNRIVPECQNKDFVMGSENKSEEDCGLKQCDQPKTHDTSVTPDKFDTPPRQNCHDHIYNKYNNKELLLRNNPISIDPLHGSDQKLNSDLTVSEKQSKKHFYTPYFESFWEVTNKRGKKLQAFNAWKRNGCETRNMIELYENHYVVKFGDNEQKFQAHISTWIESKPWDEPAPLTQDEVIAKACEQIQATKDNTPKKGFIKTEKYKNENRDLAQDFGHVVLALGLFVPKNVLEAFIEALKSKNMSCSEYALQIHAKEMEKIKFEKLDVVDCINKFIASAWKSFDVKYFVKKETEVKAKRESLTNPLALHNLKRKKQHEIN